MSIVDQELQRYGYDEFDFTLSPEAAKIIAVLAADPEQPMKQNYEVRSHEDIVKDLNAAHDLLRKVREDSALQIDTLQTKLTSEQFKRRVLQALIGALAFKGLELVLTWSLHFVH